MQPLVVATREGAVLEAALTNEKGYKKSLEQGALWTLNPATERLLPHEPAYRLVTITDEGGWYRALVEVAAEVPAAAGRASAGSRARSDGPAAADAVGGPQPGAEEQSEVIARLYELVRERQQAMPEGSYTTHLFSSGLDKIRKKTGEEAVELVLARERPEIISESADLIYHLLVLLRAADIEARDVLDELASRLES